MKHNKISQARLRFEKAERTPQLRGALPLEGVFKAAWFKHVTNSTATAKLKPIDFVQVICSEALSALRGRLRLNSHGLGAAQGKTSQLGVC
ncbi:hypothetical protein WJX79_009556 [Trebouxia sp. C0005]